MPARTFTTAGVNNLWSNPANWDGGATIPQEDDSVTIPAGQTCEYDYNSAYTTGINGITINGTLKLTRTAGTYKLFMKAATTINGAGTFDCGASALDPIPFAAKHFITGGAGWYVNGAAGLTMTVYAAEPVIKYVSLTGVEAIGQTELSVDTNVGADIWQAGDTVSICDILTYEIEERVIAAGGIAAGAITVTAGLTAAKGIGATVALCTRNVRFVGVTSGYIIRGFAEGKLTIAGGEYAHTLASGSFFYGNTGMVFSGGCVHVGGNVIQNASIVKISGGVLIGASLLATCHGASISGGHILGNSIAITSSSGVTITGGDFRNGTYVINQSVVSVFGGTFTNFGRFSYISQVNINNGVMSNNTVDFDTSPFTAFNTAFSTNDVSNYKILSEENLSQSFDHDQVAGAYKAWSAGGITTKQAVTIPTGYDDAMQTTLESATKKGYWQKEIVVGAGASVNITMNLRKDASMAYLPRVVVFNKAAADPFAGGAGLYTFTMTNSVDTWEDDVYTYTNSTSEDVTLVIRCQGMNATGNMYSALLVEQINVDLTGAIAKIDVIDGLVDAIKAKTDQLAFTVANQVDANALTGGGGLTQADVRTAVGLATANLDTQLSAIDTDVLGATVEGSYSVQDILKIMASVLAGKASGGGTTNIKYRDLSDTLDRIDETVDSNGNRTTVTRNTA